ncbi:hypothetical protein L7F22_005336 [Adiantum nelumboides]|nr:hypothetical protein [Adiantum nelumboides]
MGFFQRASGKLTFFHDFALCFCASGDLRNVFDTVCQLPEKFGSQVTIYINDHNPIIMARNFLMLRMLQAYGSNALDSVIALWYSAALTHEQSIVIYGVVINTLKSTAAYRTNGDFHVDFQAPSCSSFRTHPVPTSSGGADFPFQQLAI